MFSSFSPTMSTIVQVKFLISFVNRGTIFKRGKGENFIFVQLVKVWAREGGNFKLAGKLNSLEKTVKKVSPEDRWYPKLSPMGFAFWVLQKQPYLGID